MFKLKQLQADHVLPSSWYACVLKFGAESIHMLRSYILQGQGNKVRYCVSTLIMPNDCAYLPS